MYSGPREKTVCLSVHIRVGLLPKLTSYGIVQGLRTRNNYLPTRHVYFCVEHCPRVSRNLVEDLLLIENGRL